MRFEIIAVGISFAVTSLYWLVAAFRMSAANYGYMMQVQAFIVIVTAVFSLRTHDLVFYLQKTHSWVLKRSFNFAQLLEIALIILSTASATVLLILIPRVTNNTTPVNDIATWALISFLANITLLQGSSLAYLRTQHLDSNIAWSDFFTIGAWGGALFWLAICGEPKIFEVLGVGFAAAATRPILLLIISRFAPLAKTPHSEATAVTLDRNDIGYFLLAGQFTNMMKNSLVSLETLLLGHLVSVESVAVFRISRSFLGLTTAMLNISYQKTFRELVKCKTQPEIEIAINLMNRRSVKLWAFSIPLTVTAAFLFSRLNGDTIYNNLPLMTLIAVTAYLPVALQQTYYALLSLEASFCKINIAYVIGISLLLLVCLISSAFMTLPLFILISGAANFARLWIMRKAVGNIVQ